MYKNIGKSARALSAILAAMLLLASCGGNGTSSSEADVYKRQAGYSS